MLKINEAFYHLQGKDLFVQKKHSHNEIELIHVVNGNGMLIKDNVTFDFESGHIFVIDARNAHIVYPQPEDCRDYIRNKIVVDADSFEEFCKSIGVYGLLDKLFKGAPVSATYHSNIDICYKKVCELVNADSKEISGFLHGYIVELLHFLYANLDENIYRQDEIIQTILKLISEKNGKTSLEEISNEIHMSKFYVSHMFKSKTGRNISDYISDKLYENSVKMLKDSRCSVEEIAFECGFSAASSFTRFFKSKSGVSPSKFRKDRTTI